MNCFLWWADYALEENVLTEEMWIFAAYFILRGRDTLIDFLPVFGNVKLFIAAFKSFRLFNWNLNETYL